MPMRRWRSILFALGGAAILVLLLVLLREKATPPVAHSTQATIAAGDDPGAATVVLVQPPSPNDRTAATSDDLHVQVLRVLSLPDRRAVPGVTLRLKDDSGVVSCVTDAEGRARFGASVSGRRRYLEAECPYGFLMGVPCLLDASVGETTFLLTDALRVQGQVRDETGDGVADARIYLCCPQGLDSALSWPDVRELGRSDAAGLYDIRVSSSLPAGSSLVAERSPLIPAVERLDPPLEQSTRRDMVMTRGHSWKVRVTDESGLVMDGVRLTAITADSPALPGWPTEEVLGTGVVTRDVVTDSNGLATVTHWPQARPSRLRVAQSDKASLLITLVDDPDARILPNGTSLEMTPPREAVTDIRLARVLRDVLRVRGVARGFSTEELNHLYLYKLNERGTGLRAKLDVSPDGTFEVSIGLLQIPGDMRDDLRMRLEARIVGLPGTAWHREVGRFDVQGTLLLEGVIVQR